LPLAHEIGAHGASEENSSVPVKDRNPAAATRIKRQAKTMAEKNLMSAIAGLSDAKPDPDAKAATEKKKSPKVVNIGRGGSYKVKDSAKTGQHPHRNLGEYLHPAKGK
jgi:hypothetical protein